VVKYVDVGARIGLRATSDCTCIP